MVELFANSGDPDQTPHSAASDLGLHCLPVTLLGVSRLQWVNADTAQITNVCSLRVGSATSLVKPDSKTQILTKLQ